MNSLQTIRLLAYISFASVAIFAVLKVVYVMYTRSQHPVYPRRIMGFFSYVNLAAAGSSGKKKYMRNCNRLSVAIVVSGLLLAGTLLLSVFL